MIVRVVFDDLSTRSYNLVGNWNEEIYIKDGDKVLFMLVSDETD